MNAGAAGVVAMRYSVYVVTAAQFVAELYGALARGRTLGEAVAWARGNLADEPDRKIAYDGAAVAGLAGAGGVGARAAASVATKG